MSSAPSQPKTAVEFFNAGAAQYEEATGGCTREMGLKLLDHPQLSGVFSPDAKVLDNACGTAIMAEEIAKRCAEQGIEIPSIASVDAAEKMVEISKKKLEGAKNAEKLSFATMPGEKLDYEDGAFSHSITNLGILFFKDGEAGAKEIYRTLKEGGVAAVTTWADLGYPDAVIRPAQRAVRPGEPVFKLPIPETWFNASHVEETFKNAGFKGVEVFETRAHYGGADVEDLTRLFVSKFPGVTDGYNEAEKERYRAEVRKLVEGSAEAYKRPSGEDGLGVPMRGIVAICTK